MTLRIKTWFFRGVAIFAFLSIAWVSFYIYRSHGGSYHEIIGEGGVAHALWFPTDFEPRQVAPARPHGLIGRGRYAPQTQLPNLYPMDWPLVMLDRWLFHKTTQTISGQGDMPRLYDLSQDGRTLIPVNGLN